MVNFIVLTAACKSTTDWYSCGYSCWKGYDRVVINHRLSSSPYQKNKSDLRGFIFNKLLFVHAFLECSSRYSESFYTDFQDELLKGAQLSPWSCQYWLRVSDLNHLLGKLLHKELSAHELAPVAPTGEVLKNNLESSCTTLNRHSSLVQPVKLSTHVYLAASLQQQAAADTLAVKLDSSL